MSRSVSSTPTCTVSFLCSHHPDYLVSVCLPTRYYSATLYRPYRIAELTMQQAVFQQFHNSTSEYRFTNRSPEMLFSRKTFEWVKVQVGCEYLLFFSSFSLFLSLAFVQAELIPAS